MLDTTRATGGHAVQPYVLVERMLCALTAMCSEAAQPAHARVVARSTALTLVVRQSYQWCVEGTTAERFGLLVDTVGAARRELDRLAREGSVVGALPERIEELNEAVVALVRVVRPPEPAEPSTDTGAERARDDEPPVVEVRRLPALPPDAAKARTRTQSGKRARTARAMDILLVAAALALAVGAWLWISRARTLGDPTEHNRELLRSQTDQGGLVEPGVFRARRAPVSR